MDRIESGEISLNETTHTPKETFLTVTRAINDYLSYCETCSLAESTIRSYNITLQTLRNWMAANKYPEAMSKLNIAVLDEFQKHRSTSTEPITLRKEIIHLRTFFAWCVKRELTPTNQAKHMTMPKTQGNITMPFDNGEVKLLTGALSTIPQRKAAYGSAMLYTLLYSGLRISDVIQLKTHRLGDDGRLLLRMEKTGHAVYVKLHQNAIDALKGLATSVVGPYFFWDDTMKLSSAINQAREFVGDLGLSAGVPDVRPHRFRDTFAVNLLLAGVDIRTVQLLLGHTSLRTTEQHYAPYVKEFQVKLDAAVDKLSY